MYQTGMNYRFRDILDFNQSVQRNKKGYILKIKETQYLLIIAKNIFRRRRRMKHIGGEEDYLEEWARR